jgi:hypothetical protein
MQIPFFGSGTPKFETTLFVVLPRIGNASWERGELAGKTATKKTKSSELSFAAPRLVPSPGTLPT